MATTLASTYSNGAITDYNTAKAKVLLGVTHTWFLQLF